MSPESATSRVARLLTMVPWLLTHEGVPMEEAAAEFGLSVPQLESDLELLFLCGTPGGMPDDLIEAEWESGRIYLGNADEIARPLRLGLDEALTLIVALRTIAEVPELGDRDVVDRALGKLVEATAGGAAQLADTAGRRIQVEVADEAEAAHLRDLRDALQRHRRVHLAYVDASRDRRTERDVDPMRLLAQDGHWYLEAWCHRARDVRLFRLDRIVDLDVLDADGTPPPDARPRDTGGGVFRPAPQDTLVELDLDPSARWVADYYPHESLDERPDGGARLRLRVADDAWVRRLVWRLGGHARIAAPPELARQAAADARAALDAYDGDRERESDGEGEGRADGMGGAGARL